MLSGELDTSRYCFPINKEMVEHNEDCTEFGGYFIVNGNEKIVRMLIVQKRNFPIAFKRPGYK